MADLSLQQPPHDSTAEAAVLGGLLLKEDAIPDVRSLLTEGDFYIEANRHIYQAICELDNRSEKIDILKVKNELERQKKLDKVGGHSYLAAVYDNVIASANVLSYAGIVRQKSLLRILINKSRDIIEQCFVSQKDPDELLREAEQSIFSISVLQQRSEDLRLLGDIYPEALAEIEAKRRDKNDVTGIGTGLVDLDRHTTGFHGGQLIIIGARPGMGKTSLALNFSQFVAVRQKKPVVIFSLEMSMKELALRILSSESMIDNKKLRTGYLSEQDFKRMLNMMDHIREAPIFVDDDPQTTVLEMRTKLQRLKRKVDDIGLIIVDYLQLMTPERSGRSESRQQDLADISRRLKGLARDMDVPIVALTQLNRSIEHRQQSEPRLADIRESGAIEQDADMVIFLHKPSEDADTPSQATGEESQQDSGVMAIDLIIAKNRAGAQARIKVNFFKNITRFESFSAMDENM